MVNHPNRGHETLPVCDTTMNADIIGTAATADQAISILVAHFTPLGITVSAAKRADVLLRELEQPRNVKAWIPA